MIMRKEAAKANTGFFKKLDEFIDAMGIFPSVVWYLFVTSLAIAISLFLWSIERLIILILLIISTILFIKFKYIPFVKKHLLVCHAIPYFKKT